MISYKEAIKKLNKSYLLIKSETVFSKNSLYRICSENIYSKFNYPAANNTAYDGFALNSKETRNVDNSKKIQLKILKTIAAGDNPKIKKVPQNSCIEVMTGAIINKPFDTIIPYEQSVIIKKNNSNY